MPLRRSTYLLGTLVGLLWLGLAVWISLDVLQSRERDLQAAQRQGEALARVLESSLQGSIQKIDLRLQEFISRYQEAVIAGRPRSELEPELGRSLHMFPETSSFRVADAEGNYAYDGSGTLGNGVNIADRSYFKLLRDQPQAGLVVSEPMVSRITGDWVVVAARRLSDKQGRFGGIVTAAIKVRHFEYLFSTLNLGPRDVIAVWTRDMHLVARWPRLDAQMGQRLDDSAILPRLAAGEESGSFSRGGALDGVARQFVFRALPGTPFIITVGYAEDDILAPWRHRALIYALLGAVLTAALLFGTVVWSRRFRAASTLAERMSQAFQDKDRESCALLDAIPDPAWLLTPEGNYLSVNSAFCRYAGRPLEEIIGRNVADLFSPEETERMEAGRRQVVESRQPLREEVWLSLPGGRKPFEFLRVPVFDDNGAVRALAGVAWDISARYKAEERQRLITHVFDHSTEAILILDDQGLIVTFNNAFAALTGYAVAEVKGQNPAFLASPHNDPGFRERIRATLERGENWLGEAVTLRKDGSDCPVWCNFGIIHDDRGAVINKVAFVTDLSEKKAAQAQIESLSNVDQLTALPNRQWFSRILGDWLAEGRPGALVMLDLDHLSRINDAFGHAAGDELLRRIGERLRKGLRPCDILGRLGGDQFGMLVDLSDESRSVATVARHLLDILSHPVKMQGSDVVTTACAGITLFPQDASDTAILLRNVDTAMHHAKRGGQNAYHFFSPELNERMVARLRLESELRLALQLRQLELHYQPQVEIGGGIIGFEALLRWNHPRLGMVSPAEFIPLAEESRLILPIGAWVLTEACRQARQWQDAGLPPTVVAVNLSAVQFQERDLVAQVSAALMSSGLAPRWLELEITESVIMQEPERTAGILEELKCLGVRLSIDDFGTGYSSLAYLKRFPIDKIKIDRSFIRDVVQSPGDAAIVRMVIAMAGELERKVIAEGVETTEQLDFLRLHQCHEFQGFLCSRPVPAGRVPELLAAGAAIH
ncbi:hypothetical protein AZSI13_08030 [Azospira sp. I13]|uniref:bifunctional diguanylate cyclase/phosphodiesterase n=1 Tax=Azospira sp. I13 TaxID=1765050 RepID=UPI000D4D082A|nr:EAL domain-containing protein [Azospira sp. I13]GBG01476.1 hypothetical protein AZSI13_08030 [Azospira sp. I13]